MDKEKVEEIKKILEGNLTFNGRPFQGLVNINEVALRICLLFEKKSLQDWVEKVSPSKKVKNE